MKTVDQIKAIENKGEFITLGEAKQYCRIHGLDCLKPTMPIFQIAGALRDARKDERKKTLEKIVSDDTGETIINACRNSIKGKAERNERQKIAEEVKALQIGDITTAETIYNSILEG